MQHGTTGVSYASSDSWIILSEIEQSIKQKINAVGIPLRDWKININYGIKTGLNDAFIIDTAKKDALIAEDPRSAEIIRPILRGRDIKRYGYQFADLWVINTHNGVRESGIPRINVEEYPAVKAHLDMYYPKLVKRADKGETPYNLRNCAYMDDFSQPKIAFAETMRVHRTGGADRFPRFSYVDEGYFHDKTSFIATGPDLMYVLAVMNSAVMNYYIHKNIAVLDTGGFLMQKIYIDMLPIPRASVALHDQIQALAQQVIELRRRNEDTSILESEIDDWVYMIFGFTDDEIAYIRHT